LFIGGYSKLCFMSTSRTSWCRSALSSGLLPVNGGGRRCRERLRSLA
jgi:hypothetical protein